MAVKKVAPKKSLKQAIAESKKPWDWQEQEDPYTLLKIISDDLAQMSKDLKGIIANLKKGK